MSKFGAAELSSSRCFNGFQKIFQHTSDLLGCTMRYGVYLPDSDGDETAKIPTLFFLSGLTCTEENFIIKSGMQRWASKHKIMVINTDTSPRNLGSDFEKGYGAGFYLDATESIWSKHFKMYSYIVHEFIPYMFSQFVIDSNRCGIFGHSMGGNGALVIGLNHPDKFKSISVFAPLCNPTESSLAHPLLEMYLGKDRVNWSKYDAVEVARAYSGPKRTILIDQGSADNFLLADMLKPQALLSIKNSLLDFNYLLRNGYDHGYYYIQTFIEEHFEHHIKQWEN